MPAGRGRPDPPDQDCSNPDCWPRPLRGQEFFAPFVYPKIDPEFCARGRIAGGIFKILRSCASHCFVRMLKISVREALVGSVTCAAPPVSFQMSQLSIIPKQNKS